MKTALILIALSFPFGAFAKVADFNALITENASAQKELHQEMKANVDEGRLAIQQEARSTTIADTSGPTTVNVKTDKKFMRFKKEVVDHQAKRKDLERRLANEFHSIDSEF